MISSALEVSKAWSAGLNRLGWGCISACLLFWGLGADAAYLSSFQADFAITGQAILIALMLFLSSAVVGSMAITLGSISDRSGQTLAKRVSLAERLGRLNNPLLSHHYVEATLHFEMAAGLKGTILIGGFAFFVRWLSGSLHTEAAPISSGFSWTFVSAVVFVFFFDWLLNRSAVEALKSLEAAVKEAEARELIGVTP